MDSGIDCMVSTRLRAVTTISFRPGSSLPSLGWLAITACARAADGASKDVPAIINEPVSGITRAWNAVGPIHSTLCHPYDECIVRPPEFIIVLVAYAGSTPGSTGYGRSIAARRPQSTNSL